MNTHLLHLLVLLVLSGRLVSEASAENGAPSQATPLTVPGLTFDAAGPDGVPPGWRLPKVGRAPKAELLTEENRRYLRVTSGAEDAYAGLAQPDETGGMRAFTAASRLAYPGLKEPERSWERGAYSHNMTTAVAVEFPVPGEEWETLRVRVEYRTPDLKRSDAGSGGFFLKTPRRLLGPLPESESWTEHEFTIPVGPRDEAAALTFGFVGARGVFDVASLKVAVTKMRAKAENSAPEFTVRGGLPNVAAKLAAGQVVKIGCLGGSITAQKGWRVQTLDWFRQRYPEAAVEEIEAAIGGTGSDLGVFRVESDVLVHQPDLLFVEFAVNDALKPRDLIHKTIEGIVRKTRQADPGTDICFVYTIMHGQMEDDLAQGRYPSAARAMEEVAAHYGIPTIHLGVEVARLQRAGKLVMRGGRGQPHQPEDDRGVWYFSSDGVHPWEDGGHILYTRAVVRGLEPMLAAGQPGPHPLPAPLDPGNWQDAQLIPFGAAAQLEGDWRVLPVDHPWAVHHQRRFPQIWTSAQPGAKATIRFKGNYLGTFELIGASSGRVRVTVNGEDQGAQERFLKKAAQNDRGRLDSQLLAKDLDPGREHTVTLEVLTMPLAEKRALLRREFVNESRVQAVVEDEAQARAVWGEAAVYIGMIRLRGELIEPPPAGNDAAPAPARAK